MSPGPPIWAILTFRLGSACAIFSTMLSGGGIGPKSLLPAFAFQVPLKSVLAWAWTSPRARAKRAKENSLNVELRTKTLLLFLEHHLHVGFAHGAGDVLRPGQSLSIGGKGPAVFGSKIVPAEGTLGVDHQLVAVPFQLDESKSQGQKSQRKQSQCRVTHKNAPIVSRTPSSCRLRPWRWRRAAPWSESFHRRKDSSGLWK